MNAKEFLKAVQVIETEKGISADVIFDAIELALTAAYKKNFNSLDNVRVEMNRTTGEIHVYSFLNVVDEFSEDDDGDGEGKEILLKDAIKQVPTIKVGETIETEVTPKDFGRVATATAKQVVMQKIREAERQSIIDDFAGKEGELLVGNLSMEDAMNYYVDLGRTRGLLPKSEIIPGETLEMGSSIKVYVSKVEATSKGPVILLSRKHYGFVKRLMELEIPEINDGIILVYAVAREAGVRTKIAVYSENSNVDPIGSCIGERGSRINRIIQELNGEKIDLVKYDRTPETFLANALSPAKNITVMIMDPKKSEAVAICDGENFSLALGRKGLNVKLASRLTHYRIDVKTTEQFKEETGIEILQSRDV